MVLSIIGFVINCLIQVMKTSWKNTVLEQIIHDRNIMFYYSAQLLFGELVAVAFIMSLAWVIFRGGLVCTSVLSTLFTVWCILSQIALDCRFLLVEHISLMLKISNSHWKFCPMNSPPLSCRHCTGRGYGQSQLCVNLSCMCLAVLSSTQISLTKIEAIPMQVNALNSSCWPLTLTFHGPIKSMGTSSQGAIRTSCLGRRP